MQLSMQCMICIWILANRENYRSIADRFNVSKSSIFHCLIRTCKILCQKTSEFITWLTRQAITETRLNKIKSFPNVLEVIDGCHINIFPTKQDSISYVNRKRHFYRLFCWIFRLCA